MTGTYADFTGDDELTGFDAVIGEMLVKNELGGSSSGYELRHAPGSRSGYSFGGNQMDLSKSSQGKNVLQDILEHARDASGNLIFTNGQQFYTDNFSAIKAQGSLSLDVVDPNSLAGLTYKQEINAALQSSYGKAAINAAFPIAVSADEAAVNSIIEALPNGNIKTTLENSQELQAYLIDHYNQFGIVPNGTLVSFLSGNAVTPYGSPAHPHSGPAIQLDGMITLADLKNYLDQTKYAEQSTSHDSYVNRQNQTHDILVEHEVGKYLSGNGDDNTLTGTAFHDTIDGKGGIDSVFAGGGDDLVIYREADNNPLFVTNEYLSGGSGDDTLKLYFKSSELTSALREELLDVYNGMVINNIPGTYSHTFTNLKLEISDFEHLQVFVDGKEVSLAPHAVDNYYVMNNTGNLSTTLWWMSTLLDPDHISANSDHSYSFGSISATPGTYSTVAGGTIVISSDASFAYYAPSTSYIGQDSYTYTVTDASGQTTSATDYFIAQQYIHDLDTNTLEGNSYSASGPTSVELQGHTGPIIYAPDRENYIITDMDYNYSITGSAYADTLSTGGGNTIIHGGAGNDNIGGGGSYYNGYAWLGDYFHTSSSLYGDDGDDYVGSQSGNAFLSGGNGNDVISYNSYLQAVGSQ